MRKIITLLTAILTTTVINAQQDSSKVEMKIGKTKVLVIDDNGHKTSINIAPDVDLEKLLDETLNFTDSLIEMTIKEFNTQDTVEVSSDETTKSYNPDNEEQSPDTVEIGFGKFKMIVIDNPDHSIVKMYSEKDDNDTTKKVIFESSEEQETEQAKQEEEFSDDSNTTATSEKTIKFRFNKNDERKFEADWAGVELGINTWYNGATFDMPAGFGNMELNYGKSWFFNINALQYKVGLIKDNLGFVTGLGFGFSNYRFLKSSLTLPNPDTAIGVIDTSHDYVKSKLQTTYLRLPLFLEVKLPEKSNFHIMVGAIGQLLIGSHTKYVYYTNNNFIKNRSTVKNHNITYLNMLNYSLSLRIGIENVTIFMDYGMMPVFKTNRGPEVYPLNFGINLTF